MDFLVYLYVFILGTIIGSFLNVVVDRMPKEESLVKTRSHCDHCQHKLAWFDLVPLFSYFSLRGRCRYCKVSLSFYYPLVEIITGLLFMLVVFFVFGLHPLFFITDIRLILAAVYFFCIVGALTIIFFVDLKYGIIPFTVVGFALVLSIIWYLLFPYLNFAPTELSFVALRSEYLLNYFLSGLGAFLFFLALFLGTKGRGLGFGDVVFAFLMGFLLGFPKIILAFYIAFLAGAFISLILILVGRKKLKKSSIPFGPFLVLGTIISLFWGQPLIIQILLWLLGS